MALQQINVGNFKNDGTGDDLRTAFSKVNDNFNELDLRGGQANTISNVGVGVGLYKEKIGVDLRLKTLKGGNGITLVAGANDITINGSTYTLESDTNPSLSGNLQLNGHNIVGANTTSVTAGHFYGPLTGNVLAVDIQTSTLTTGSLNTGSLLAGPVTAGTVTAGTINAGTFNGNLNGLVYGYDLRAIARAILGFDFGPIVGGATNVFQLTLALNLIDMGSILHPNTTVGIDGGTII